MYMILLARAVLGLLAGKNVGFTSSVLAEDLERAAVTFDPDAFDASIRQVVITVAGARPVDIVLQWSTMLYWHWCLAEICEAGNRNCDLYGQVGYRWPNEPEPVKAMVRLITEKSTKLAEMAIQFANAN